MAPATAISERPSHIWTVAVPDVVSAPQKAVQVTNGTFAETAAFWSKDGKRIFFGSERDPEPYYKPPTGELYSVEAGGGEMRSEVKLDGGIRGATLDPSGTRVTFVAALNGDPIKSHSQADLWVSTLNGGKPRNLTAAFDNDINRARAGIRDLRRAGGRRSPCGSGLPLCLVNGRRAGPEQSEAHRCRNREGRAISRAAIMTSIHGAQRRDGSKFAVAISSPTNIGDLYFLDTATKRCRSG